MPTSNFVRLFGLFIWFGLLSGEETRPNILIFMVDDLGMGDLPCFGNRSIKTPNIDQLSAEGAKLTHHTSPAVFCTPSRAAFLTGRYAVRSGLTSVPRSPPVIVYASGTAGLPRNETAFATLLKSQGYKTGLIGKWHLGLNQKIWGDMGFSPLGHGFDYFFGLPFTRVGSFGTQDG
ncbi:arylsulfatase H [Eurytemora carolleeae]|uniref:arylsulfatase H n=1 Tax=Eurytemora carolleeae TaxID=1294199 RepID=UPI000C7605D5|nr:arylsulfatase H [Eurytemora carolleeae]|eukprot:XP_023346481.1 arylsulfatase H-like [Eurytemora affinis]